MHITIETTIVSTAGS